MRSVTFAAVVALCTALALGSGAARAQVDRTAPPDPAAVLAAAKAASGGAAWDALSVQHAKVSILTGGLTGAAERWSDIATGRSYMRFSLGPMSGTLGYDGSVTWTQDASGQSRIESAEAARELAVNAAYRDRLAFWFPQRQPAAIRYKGRSVADGADFDVVAITPEGGREFDLWINTETKMIERLVEQEAGVTRTERYMDWRDIEGVKLPFRVRTSRGDPKSDEVVVVETMEFNTPLAGIDFARPGAPKADFVFAAGKTSVELPVEVVNGHLFVHVQINGKGPLLMLLDSASPNAVTPEAAKALGLEPETSLPAGASRRFADALGIVRVARLEVAGVTIDDEPFAVVPLADSVRRFDGVDGVAGLIGYELFKRFPILVDYQRARVVIFEPTAFGYRGDGVRVPFQVRDHAPRVQGSVDGIEGSFAIDIGTRRALVLAAPFVQKHGLAAKYGATQEVIAGVDRSGYARALLGRAGTLRLGDVATYDPVTYLATVAEGPATDPDLAGNVGYAVLRRFNITFDYPHEQLYFEKNANYGEKDAHDRAGLWVERGEKGYVLVEVVPAGPAATAGLKSGDTVVAVDGKPVASVSLAQFRLRLMAAPGTKVRLKLQGGATRVVTLRDLV